MPKKSVLFIRVPVADSVYEFQRNARKAYRAAFPNSAKTPGRKSEEQAVLNAMKDICLGNSCGWGEIWSQQKWSREIQARAGYSISKRTIDKHLKTLLARNILPLHMIPESYVNRLPSDQQRTHWLAVGWAETIFASKYQGKGLSISRHNQKILKRHLSHPF